MPEICIDNTGCLPIYQQIMDQVIKLVADRQLRPGEQLPAVRELARWLQVNPSTVARAYYGLKEAGVVATSRRRGTIILGNGRDYSGGSLLKGAFTGANGGKTKENPVPDISDNKQLKAALVLHLAHWRIVH